MEDREQQRTTATGHGGLGGWRWELAAMAVLAILALAVGIELARPFRGAGIAFDSQVSVFHFDRLVTGRQMAEPTTTTAKPLLSAAYGVLHHATGGWHAISYATILAYAAGTVASALLAARLGGPLAAGFAGVGIAMSPRLLFDTGQALATPWALPLWALAGLAVSAARPRYGVAGLALALATLARLETVIVTGVALAAVIVHELLRRRTRDRPLSTAWRLPVLALSALLILGLHDWLLTGDPLRWTKIATEFSERTTREILTPAGVVGLVWSRWTAVPILTVLAVIGVVGLVRAGRWPVALGIIALGPVVLAALVVIAARGVFVDLRYFAGPELAGTLAAAIGLASVPWSRFGARLDRLRRAPALVGISRAPVTMLVVGAVVALVVAQPYWWREPGIRGTIRRVSALAADADRAIPLLRASLAGTPDPARPSNLPPVIVPPQVRFRTIVDLGTSESQVGGMQGARFDLASGYPAAGQVVFHHRIARDPGDPATVLETMAPVVVGGVRLEPILVDDVTGMYVLRIARLPGR